MLVQDVHETVAGDAGVGDLSKRRVSARTKDACEMADLIR